MRFLRFETGALATGLFLLCVGLSPLPARAEPITPMRDDEVIEVLPAASANRDEDRRLRRQLAERPNDAALAVSVATRDFERAREAGDPRFAGLALAALRPWHDSADAPAGVLLMRATLQQYLHEFDASVVTLKQLVSRPRGEQQAQAWLTLATILRVQGKYTESDAACRHVGSVGAPLYASACLAENAGLRGHVDEARSTLMSLLRDPQTPRATQGWLLTTLAELEERDGRKAQADKAYKAALRAGPDTYAATAYADFLIADKRPAEALKVLAGETRTDPILLRLAIAGRATGSADAARDVAEMRARIALANERPDAKKFHGREQAMFALQIDHDADRALALARGDVDQQREALDLLVLAEAARASGREDAIAEARALKQSIGLHDRRIDALL